MEDIPCRCLSNEYSGSEHELAQMTSMGLYCEDVSMCSNASYDMHICLTLFLSTDHVHSDAIIVMYIISVPVYACLLRSFSTSHSDSQVTEWHTRTITYIMFRFVLGIKL